MRKSVTVLTTKLNMVTDMRNYLPKEIAEEIKKWTEDPNHINYMSEKIKASQKRIH